MTICHHCAYYGTTMCSGCMWPDSSRYPSLYDGPPQEDMVISAEVLPREAKYVY